MLGKLLHVGLAFLPQPKVSVVIPVLNEEKTVGAVVRLAKKNKIVGEVIVVDDNSAGIGVAFCSKNGLLNAVADKVIEKKSFREIPEFTD